MYKTSTTRWRSSLAVLALLAGCAGDASGPPQSQQRQVSDFHAIELRGAADLAVAVGSPTSLTVSADAATLGDVKTWVENGKLIIESHRRLSWFRGGSVKLQLATPTLDELALNGAGDAAVTGIKGAKLVLELDGAGNLRASGATDALEARIKGAGDMDLSELVARDAKVSVNGAGDLKVRATGALEATVNGVGTIIYSGNPQPVKTEINGVGSIKPAAPGAA